MLPRQYRLPKQDLIVCTKSGQRLFFPAFICLYRLSKSPFPRFGIIVHKKKEMNAVLRNQIKRHIREAILQSVNELKKPYEIVFISKIPISNIDPLFITNQVSSVFSKLSQL